jgi:hypothetical protein
LIHEHGTRPVDFAGFQRIVERSAGGRFHSELFFDDWFYGSASSELLLQPELTVAEIARRYRR